MPVPMIKIKTKKDIVIILVITFSLFLDDNIRYNSFNFNEISL